MKAELHLRSASAGTGKTTWLSDEIIKIICPDNDIPHDPESLAANIRKVVGITFSNMAAKSFKEKVMEKLKNKLIEKLNSDEILYKAILIQPLRITTIHSFVLELLSALRIEKGIALPQELFPVEEENEVLWEENVNRFLTSIPEWLDEEKRNELKNHRDFWIKCMGREGFRKFLLDIGKELAFYSSLLGDKFYHDADEKRNKDIIEDRELIYMYHSLTQTDQEELEKIDEIKDLMMNLKNSGKIGGLFSILRFILDEYIYDIQRTGNMEFETAIFLFLKFAYEFDKEERDKKIIEKLKERGLDFEYLFVDEAQDNSLLQYLFIEVFVPDYYPQNVTCYIVGDRKQAIYHWREAYPDLFKKQIEIIKSRVDRAKGVKYDTLKSTYRIESEGLLSFINQECKKLATNKEVLLRWGNYIEDEDKLEFPNGKKTVDNATEYFLSSNKGKPTGTIGVIIRSRNEMNNAKRIANELSLTPIDRAGIDISNSLPVCMLNFLLNFLLNKFDLENCILISLAYPFNRFQSTKELVEFLNEFGDEKNVYEIAQKLTEKVENVSESNGHSIVLNLLTFLDKEFKAWKYMPNNERRNLKHLLLELIGREKVQYSSKSELRSNFKGMLKGRITNTPQTWGSPKEGTVEILTIHASKGLEYDCVFLLGTNELQKGDVNGQRLKDDYGIEVDIVRENGLPVIEYYWMPFRRFSGLLAKREVRERVLSEREKCTKESHTIMDWIDKFLYLSISSKINENYNLYYVGITRPKKSLYIIAERDKEKEEKAEEKIPLMCVFKRIKEAASPPQITEIYPISAVSEILSPPITKTTYKLPSEHLKNLKAINVGKVAHFLVEQALLNLLKSGRDINVSMFIYHVERIAEKLKRYFTEDWLDDAVSIIKCEENKGKIIELAKFLGDSSVDCEVPILFKDKKNEKDKYCSGIIDLFGSGVETIKVVELKFSALQENSLKAYNEQLELYKRGVSLLFPEKMIDGKLIVFQSNLESDDKEGYEFTG